MCNFIYCTYIEHTVGYLTAKVRGHRQLLTVVDDMMVQMVVEKYLQVLRAFGIPQRKHLYFISVSGHFWGHRYPLPQLE
jgi:hypothetical protein